MKSKRNKKGQFLKNVPSFNTNWELQKITKEEWAVLYIDKKLSTYKIGKIFNVTGNCIRQYLIKNNIKRRNSSEALKGRVSPMKGKRHSEESKLKMKFSQMKDVLSPRCDYYPAIFYKIRPEILERDDYICQNPECGVSEEKHLKLNVHHIDYNKQNCDESNLITVCHSCNSKANFNRDYWYAFYTYLIENKIYKGVSK